MVWENWTLAICAIIVAAAFLVLVIYVIIALLSMKRIVNDLDQKIHAFDPLFRILTKAGNVIEKKTDQELAEVEEELYKESEPPRRNGGVNTAIEVAEWALIGLSLWQKIRERRR
jgi:hypothetical protein